MSFAEQVISDCYYSIQDAYAHDLRFDIIASYLETIQDFEIDDYPF